MHRTHWPASYLPGISDKPLSEPSGQRQGAGGSHGGSIGLWTPPSAPPTLIS
ncbi:MAG: hypothetical protein LBV05_15875 [Comamonas sp.]|uniref:hypothetical protein n=1 Tax=Comamonas sp. TaxID=34028 RepID=UPI0025C0BABA|nr:hypothetical protein [Comamonas sp.]MDR3066964.1 hypothetical protein [Comamonas sp.]